MTPCSTLHTGADTLNDKRLACRDVHLRDAEAHQQHEYGCLLRHHERDEDVEHVGGQMGPHHDIHCTEPRDQGPDDQAAEHISSVAALHLLSNGLMPRQWQLA